MIFFFEMEENRVGKGEMIVNIFLLSLLCFPKPSPFGSFDSLQNDKFLDWFSLKTFADDKINLAEKIKFVLGRVENIVGKGENAGYQHFLLFPQCF